MKFFLSRSALKLSLVGLMLAASGAAFAQSDSAKLSRYYDDALKRFEQRDYPGAIIQLKNSLQIDPSQLSVHLLLGKALMANSEVALAELEFSEAIRLGVNRAEVVVPLAEAMVAQGKQAQMFADARLNPAGLPDRVRQRLLLVRASASSDIGDARGATKAVEEARAIDPANVGSWLAEVPLRVRARQFKEAMAAVDQALKLEPKSSDAFYQKASILHVQGQIGQALAGYDRSLQLDDRNTEARLARAGILLDLNRTADAQAEVDKLLRQAPDDPRGTYLLGQLADRAGNAALAKESMKKVTELLDPVPIDFMRYRVQLLMLNGLAHFDLKELEKAKPYLEMAGRQVPNSPVSKLLAQIATAEGNPVRASELLETYLKSQPGDGQALLMLASAQMALGRYGKASNLLQDALQAKDRPEFRTALGISLMRSGKNGNATSELERAFKADPSQIYAGLALVDLYLRAGQLPRALQIADSLAKANPKNPSILVVQAAARLRNRDVAGARTGFEAALKLDDKLLPAKLGMAKVDLAARAFEAAEKRLAEVLKEDERNVEVLFDLATVYEAWGKNDRAFAYLERAVSASTQSQTRANYAMVAWQLRKGEPTAALSAASTLVAKLPDDVEALLTYAQAQLANGDLAGAKSTLANASRRAAYDVRVLERIARAQLDARDAAGAAYSLDKALSDAPNDLSAMALMSTVELLQGDAAKAERWARQVISTYPKAAVGWGLLADVAASRGQTAAAIDGLRRAHEIDKSEATLLRLFRALSTQDAGKPAIELAQAWLKTRPASPEVRKALGDSYARAGNFAAARQSYEAVVAARPKDAEALNNLANVLIQQKDPTAVAVAERALAQDARNAGIVDTVGWAYYNAGDNDRALKFLRDARLRSPDNPDVRYHLAVVLAQTGRHSEAREELDAALKNARFANSQNARSLLASLK